MKEWKVRQHLYHRTAEITDVHPFVDLSTDAIVDDVVEYFTIEQGKRLVYPAKSYAVALIYATLLEQHFGEDFFEALSDPLLLYGNDRWFVPYTQARDVYDSVLLRVPREILASIETCPYSQVRATVAYFKQEFLVT